METITLAKLYVVNTKMLSDDDIKDMLNHQQKPVNIADNCTA